MTTTLTTADRPRLLRQLDLVLAICIRREWLTMQTIADLMMDGYGTACSLPSVSARLRQLRSKGYIVDRRLVSPGLFVYRVRRNEPKQLDIRDIL